MMETTLLLNSLEKVRQFSSVVSTFGAECELVQDYTILDAKSVMGIFSLNLDAPVTLRIYSDNRELLDKVKAWEIQ